MFGFRPILAIWSALEPFSFLNRTSATPGCECPARLGFREKMAEEIEDAAGERAKCLAKALQCLAKVSQCLGKVKLSVSNFLP